MPPIGNFGRVSDATARVVLYITARGRPSASDSILLRPLPIDTGIHRWPRTDKPFPYRSLCALLTNPVHHEVERSRRFDVALDIQGFRLHTNIAIAE